MRERMYEARQGGAAGFAGQVTRVSAVCIAANTLLTALKLFAGIAARSGAMLSDAVHSASDVLSSVIVIIGVRLSAKAADREHPYGHERFEPVASLILAGLLAFTGASIGLGALERILGTSEDAASVPGVLALYAAVISIVVKEAMFWYTRHYARKLDSGALWASAWDHRSDALSSVGALAGIAGARLGFPVLEPIASLLICLFIFKAAFEIFRDAIQKLVDHACDAETEAALRACILAQPGVLGIDLLLTREFGNRIYVDLEIRVDGDTSLRESHAVAERVHDAIEEAFEKVKHIMIHVNPSEPSRGEGEETP